MKKYLYICPILLVSLLVLIGCKDKSFSKAEKIYKNKGLDDYAAFVEEKNTYYKITDSNNNGATPLLVAIKEGNSSFVDSFIKRGASFFTEQDQDGKDIFDYLLEKVSAGDEVRQIIEIIPVDYWSSEQNIKRLLEIESNYPLFAILVEQDKFSPDYIVGKGKTVLMYAAQHTPDIRYIKQLAEKTNDINKINDNEWNAVMYAARYNPNPAVLEYLLKKDANTERNTAGISLTMLAACNPNPGVLLNVPVTEKYINTATINGKTALMYACENNQSVDVIEILCRDFKEKIKNKYVVINNVVNYERINELASENHNSHYDIAFVGRMTEQKNPTLFIEIINDIKKKIPDVTAVMVGSGNLYDECQKLIEKYHLESNIDMIGFNLT